MVLEQAGQIVWQALRHFSANERPQVTPLSDDLADRTAATMVQAFTEEAGSAPVTERSPGFLEAFATGRALLAATPAVQASAFVTAITSFQCWGPQANQFHRLHPNPMPRLYAVMRRFARRRLPLSDAQYTHVATILANAGLWWTVGYLPPTFFSNLEQHIDQNGASPALDTALRTLRASQRATDAGRVVDRVCDALDRILALLPPTPVDPPNADATDTIFTHQAPPAPAAEANPLPTACEPVAPTATGAVDGLPHSAYAAEARALIDDLHGATMSGTSRWVQCQPGVDAARVAIRDAQPMALRIALAVAALREWATIPDRPYDRPWRIEDQRQDNLGLVLSRLWEQPLTWRTTDLEQVGAILVEDPHERHLCANSPLGWWIGSVERLDNGQALTPSLDALLRRLRERALNDLACAYVRDYLPRINALLRFGVHPAGIVQPTDGWGYGALAALEAMDQRLRQHWLTVLEVAKTATTSKPSTKFTQRLATAIAPLGEAEFRATVQRWLALFCQGCNVAQHRVLERVFQEWALNERNEAVLRGLLWGCAQFDDRDLAFAVGDTAIAAYRKAPTWGARSGKVGNAAVLALGLMPGQHGVVQLQRLLHRITDGRARNQIEQSIETAAARAGLTRADLDELVVADHGLVDGQVVVPFDGYTATIVAEGPGRVTTRWAKADGTPLKAAPAALKRDHKDALKALKRQADEISVALTSQRDRLDGLYLRDRSWSLAEWRTRYLDHPLLAILAHRLIWSFGEGDAARAGAWQDGRLVGADDAPLPDLADDTSVRLWHPLFGDGAVVAAWRDWLDRHQITQPFKQAYREVYLLTDAERRTHTYSNRYAAHIIRQHQFNALCKARGWDNQLRLMVDDEYRPPTKALPTHGLRAEFWVEGAGSEYGADTNAVGTYNWLATDQVRFYRQHAPQATAHASGGGYAFYRDQVVEEPLPLDTVPPLVFSEVMRDVDLFVGVASIGNDPTWADGGHEGPFRDYWQSYSVAELTESARGRRELLARLLPRLRIADQCEVTDRYLVVRGALSTYHIHLGSGNILMEPGSRYLCIVPSQAKAQAEGAAVLPFEGDGMLAVILSKAFLLAKDTAITDPTITRQLKV